MTYEPTSHAPARPQEVWEDLRRTVYGQDDAIREIAVAIVKHLLGHPAGNILMVGNSGTGKTTLMCAVETYLERKPELAKFSNVVRINANVLAEEQGGYGRAVLSRLYANAVKKVGPDAPLQDYLDWVERGIVFIDEVDKIRAHASGQPNVRGIVAQESLLTLMENEHVEFEIDHPMKATVSINSSAILFVAAGAFEEMYESVYRRAITGADAVLLKPTMTVSSSGDVREEIVFHLGEYLRYEDLFKYGMTPQFVSRFESIVVLNDLAEMDLARIFVEPEHSIFRTSREYFRRFNIDLQITKQAVQLLAWEAAKQRRLGARALKEAYRRLIRNLEFDPLQGRAADGAPRVVTIDDEMVRKAITSNKTKEPVRAK